MCERRVRGNQNIVQEICGCDPSCVGHMYRDLGGRACFGNYTCLSSGRDLYDADFGDLYGNQTLLVGDCKSMCDMEQHLPVSDGVMQLFF